MKKGPPLISVVIPAYNEEKYIARCLSSVQNQTFTNFEIIVVDNNCTDKTAEIARSFGAKVVKEKRQGMTPARERGFKEAQAGIIARTDADTTVYPDWLEVIYKTFQKHPKVVGITGSWLSPIKKISDRLICSYSYFVAVKLGMFFSGHIYLLGPNMAVRKDAWARVKVHTNDRMVHEDIDLSCHLIKQGEILYVPEMKVVFSDRKIREKPLKGLSDYIGEYPLRYIKTLSLHGHRFRKGKSRLLGLIKNK